MHALLYQRLLTKRSLANLGRLLSIAAAVAVCACGGSGGDGAPDSGPVPADADAVCRSAGPVVTTLVTGDGVELIADLYTTGITGAPGVILLHMIPPGNTKDNYPAQFIEPLVARGFQVINVNRRGAPGSGGEAADAYQGPGGKYDAKAAYDLLLAHPCAVPADSVAVVGASNGTTTTVDFSVYAAAEPELNQPAALVFLSGGAYTENQHPIADNLVALSAHPIYFAYPTGEAAWNQEIAAIAPAPWQFVEYSPGDHGTRLFTANPESITGVIDFLDGVL